jgi:hypothetical protein
VFGTYQRPTIRVRNERGKTFGRGKDRSRAAVPTTYGRRMVRPVHIGAIGIAAVCLTGCMPSDEDIGRMVLLESPVWFLAATATFALLSRSWRPHLLSRGIRVRQPDRLQLVALAVLCIGAVLGVAWMTEDGWSYFWGDNGNYWLGGILVGLGYLTVALVIWRIWYAVGGVRSFDWAPIAVLAVFWLPALALAYGGIVPEDLSEKVVAGYMLALYPGFYGVPTVIVLMVFLLEGRYRQPRLVDSDFAVAEPTRDGD